jgi:hypothetical protein
MSFTLSIFSMNSIGYYRLKEVMEVRARFPRDRTAFLSIHFLSVQMCTCLHVYRSNVMQYSNLRTERLIFTARI